MPYTLIIPGDPETYPPVIDGDVIDAYNDGQGTYWPRMLRSMSLRAIADNLKGEHQWCLVPLPSDSPNVAPETLDLILDMILQSCTVSSTDRLLEKGLVLRTYTFDSFGFGSYAAALRLLDSHNVLTIDDERTKGDRIIAHYIQEVEQY